MTGRWMAALAVVAMAGSGVSALAVEPENGVEAARRAADALSMATEQTPITGSLDGVIMEEEPPSAPNLKWLHSQAVISAPTLEMVEPSIATAPDGRLFAAVDERGTAAIYIYHSTDYGVTWSPLVVYAHGPLTRNPALAYAEISGQKWLVFVYELVLSDASRSLYAFRFDPDDTGNWMTVPIEIDISWLNASTELHPQITTDYLDWPSPYFYVTYATPSIEHYPVFFTRSTDQGATWSTPEEVSGGSDITGFESKPEITYCAYDDDVYIAFNKPGWTGSAWEQQVWVTKSGNCGAAGSWQAPVQVTSSPRPDHHPSIAAAWDAATIVVSFTSEYSASDNDVERTFSTDGGATWSSPVSMPGWTYDQEDNVDLAASRSAGGRFHAAYRKDEPSPALGHIHYSWAHVAMPDIWSMPVIVDNTANVSGAGFHPRPSIAVLQSVPPSVDAVMAWTEISATYQVIFDGPGAGLLFADDFESGGLTGWSATVH